ncbi:MAG: hypothetical protein ACI9VR_003765 [Cognaticolwellia sp.]|jgi:hypothetical protein
MHKKWLVVGIAALALACGGGGLSALSGGSSQAQAMCDYMAVENETECASVAVGSTATVGDFQIQVLSTGLWPGQDSLPAIKNMDERSAMKKVGSNMVAVHLQVTNTAPVKSKADFNVRLIDGGGNRAFAGPYNGGLYREEMGVSTPFGDAYAAGESRMAAIVYAVAPEHVAGSLIQLTRTEKMPDPQDPRGRIKSFVVQQFVLDLGGPTAP